MGFLLCDSFTLTFVLSRSIKLGIFCLKTLSIMINLSMHMPGVYDQLASPFFHIYYACPSKKKKHVLCLGPVGFSLPKIFLCPGLPGFIYDFFLLITCPSGIVENRYPPNIADNTLPKIVFRNLAKF